VLSAPLERDHRDQEEKGAVGDALVDEKLELFRGGGRAVLAYGGAFGGALPVAAELYDKFVVQPGAPRPLWICRALSATAAPIADTLASADARAEILASRSCMLVDLRALPFGRGCAEAILLLGVQPELRVGMTKLAFTMRRLDAMASPLLSRAVPRGTPADDAALRAVQEEIAGVLRHHAFRGALLLDAVPEDGRHGGAAGFGVALLSPSDDAGDGPASAPIPAVSRAPRAPAELDFYELVVVDEHGVALGDLAITMTTPLGTVTKRTGGDGRVRVDDAPGGTGSARVASTAALRALLRGRETSARRLSPLPDGPDWTFRTLARAGDGVTLPSGKPQRLMLVTRTDVYSAGDLPAWGDLTSAQEGPWELVAARDVRLKVHADGVGAKPSVVGEARDPTDFAPPDVTPNAREGARWIAPDVYVVQPGDTLSLIARKYLGDAARYPAIIAENPEILGDRSPDMIYVGEHFRMPAAAIPPWLRAMSLPPAPPPPPDDPTPPQFLALDADVLHEALFARDLDRALGIVGALPTDLPADSPTPPPPILEEVLFGGNLAAAALDGQIDPPFDAPEEDYVNPEEAKNGAQDTRDVA